MTGVILQAFIEVRESGAVGCVFEIVVDFMNIAIVVFRKPPIRVVAVNLLYVFVNEVAVAIDDDANELLP